MNKLSVIIITKNEQQTIRRCLESIKWADEIIVVDSGSTDNTLAICREYTDKIYHRDWPGYGIQKNRALSLATQAWVFSIDADEIVSEALAVEIQETIKRDTADAYRIRRELIFYGKPIKYAVGTDWIIRLFKRKQSRFTDDIVHEKVIVDGTVKSLKSTLYHHSFCDVNHLLEKLNKYSSLSAQTKFERGKNPSAILAVGNFLWVFFRLYFLKRGFLDGKRGLVLDFSFASAAFYRYMKCSFLYKQ